MLQEKDAEIVSRDLGVPGLATLLDADLLLDTLRALPQFAMLQALTIDYVRYKPANSCAVSLRLQFADGQQHYLFAKALTPERFLSSWHHPKRQALVAKRVPLAPVALPERAIILTYPQYDRGLPALRLLTATPDRDALFHRWLPGLSASAELTLKILRYKPERRLLALLSSNRQPYAVLRFASAGCYEAMLAGNKLGNAAGEIRLLSAPCDYHLLITAWIEGETLCPEQGGQLPKGEAYAMGSQLADMHCREFSRTTRPAVLHDDISDAWRVLNTLRVVLPEQEAVFMSLLTTLSDRIRPSSFSPVVIHGDFSVDQVVRRHADGQLQLIDWDRARLGNPAIDLASFQARLELQVIEQTLSQDVARQTIAAFHDGYCQRNGVLPPNLNDHVALALLQLAVEPFRKRSTGWPRHIAALMHRAQQLTGSGDASLQPLLDRSALAETLRKALGLSADNTLIAAETVTSKPGRRAVLEYHWHSSLSERLFSVIGKYRHKGFEPLGYAVQRALWHGGFSGKAEVIVPQPLATLPDLHLWLQQKVTGTRMTDLLNVAHQSPDELGYRTGKALATLHGSTAAQQVVAGKKWTMTDELAVLRQRLAAAETARPEWSGRINAVVRLCEQLAQLLLPSVDVFIHRDFYPAQLLVPDDAPQQIVILDFDLATTGPAALDVGNYLAHLQEQALRETGDETGFSGYEQAFIAGWQAASGRQEDGNIAIYTALALARHIGISLQFPREAEDHGAIADDMRGQDSGVAGCQGGAVMRRYGVLISLFVLFFPFESAAKPEVSPEKLRPRQLKQPGRVVVEDASQTPVNIHLRAIFEAEEIKNTKLRYGEKRTNKIEIEPTLRLDMTVFQGKPLSFFGEMEFIQKKKRQTGSSTNNTDTLNFNQGGLQLNGLVIPGSTVRLGRWLLRDERRWLFDEDIDGVYARFGDKWLTEVGAGRVNYWQRNLLDSSTRGDNNNLMTLLSQYEVSKRGRLGGYVVWQHDRSAAKNDRQLNLGVRSWSSQRGALSHWLEVGTVRGRQDDQSLRGYAVDGGATFRLVKVPLQPRFTLGYAWGSGDSDDDDGVSKRYRQTGLQGNEATLGGLAKYNIYGAALDPELTNIHILTAGAGINVGKEVSLDLIYHYYRQDHLAALVEDTTELTAKYDRMTTKKLGSALDVVIGWRPYSQVRLEARAGWFAPSSRFHSGSSHRSARSSSASSWWMKAEIRF